MSRFEEQVLKEELGQLPGRSRVAFAVSCAQRLIGVYRMYTEHSRQSEILVESALEYVWTHILKQPQKEQAERILAEVMALIPDENAPGWTPLAAYAEDALSSVAYSLRCLLSNEPQEAAWAARRVYDALDQIVIVRDNIKLDEAGNEDRIVGDPLIQGELLRQARDIDDLRSAGQYLSPSIIETLRRRSVADQVIVRA